MENKINYNLRQLPKKTFEIEVNIPWEEVEPIKNKVIKKFQETTEVKGFRKGKAPSDLVASVVGDEKILENILQELISRIYSEAIRHFDLKPVVTPKVELVSAKEKETWKIKFTSCEEPEVNLGNYKEEIKKMKLASNIWVPGKESPNEQDKESDQNQQTKDAKLSKIISWLMENIPVEISDLLVESETSHNLVEFLEELRKLNLSLDQYLATTGKTVEALREEYRQQAERTIKLQLLLKQIADQEKITVDNEEIEKMINSAQNEEEKQALEKQKYYLASILRQQKTLDFIANL